MFVEKSCRRARPMAESKHLAWPREGGRGAVDLCIVRSNSKDKPASNKNDLPSFHCHVSEAASVSSFSRLSPKKMNAMTLGRRNHCRANLFLSFPVDGAMLRPSLESLCCGCTSAQRKASKMPQIVSACSG